MEKAKKSNSKIKKAAILIEDSWTGSGFERGMLAGWVGVTRNWATIVVLHPYDRKWHYISWITLCLGSRHQETLELAHPRWGNAWSVYFCMFVFRCYCCLFALSAFTIKRKHKKGCTKCYPRCQRLFMRDFRHVFGPAEDVSEDPRRTREKNLWYPG